MVKTREDFDLETGLADDFDGAITDVVFGPNPREEYSEIAGDVPGPIITIESPDIEQPIEQWYSAGTAKEWQVVRGGKEMTSAKSPNSHRFNMNSRAGSLVGAMFLSVGNGDKAKGQEIFIARDHYMTEAEFYIGLNFHWKRQRMKTVGGGESDVLLPEKYLGEVKGKGKAATKVAEAEVDTSALDVVVAGLASGKDGKKLKIAVVKESQKEDSPLYGQDAYVQSIVSGSKLKDLVDDETLTVGPDGNYV